MESKKHVLFVIDSLNSGGAEKSLVTALNLLNQNKYTIDLLTFKRGGLYENLVPEYVNRIDPSGYPYYVNGNRNFNSKQKFLFSILRILASISLRLLKVLKILFPKLKIHPAQVNWYITRIGFSNAKKKYDSAIAYSQGLPTYFVSSKVEASTKACWINTNYHLARYAPSLDYKYYKNFDKIVCVSKIAKEVYIEIFSEFEDRTTTIYDILSSQMINKMAEEDASNNYNFDGIKILTIGRLVALKGYDIAIKAASLLKDRGINFKWYVIGEGGLEEELKQLAIKMQVATHFEFLGTYPNPYPFMKNCNIYCQTSRFEGFGLAVAEARILGKPIVTTNFDIIYDQLVDGHNGLISDMNAISVANNIERLLKDVALKDRLVANLKKEEISNESEILKIEAILDS
ncbi:glycosyltransferase [Aquimarina sp. 2-A2]|uniref:glycosyltransferase n=1 Tax=Aquimarina sp. 2-A2 TaxID=3382644 RepID=UPI00387F2A68